MYSTLFTTTLIFALAALRTRAEFSVNTVSLTQVCDSPEGSPFFARSRSFYLVWIVVPACDPHLA